MRSLNRTRESLSAEESYLEQLGQLLDKALAKQIAVREAELDSLAAPSDKNKTKVLSVQLGKPLGLTKVPITD